MDNSVEDVEIEMHIFRLMRSGRYQTAAALRAAAREDFPSEAPERIEQCLRRLATRLASEP